MRFRLILTSALIVVALGACERILDLLRPPVSRTDPVAQLVTDLNKADRSEAYLNLHATQTQEYNQWVSAALWDAGPLALANRSFSIAIQTEVPQSDGSYLVTALMDHVNADDLNVSMVMAQTGDDWFIVSITIEGSVFAEQYPL